MPHAIKKDVLNALIMKYNKQYRLKQFLEDSIRPSKDALIAELKKRNYKVVKKGGNFELHAIADPKRFKKIKLDA